MSSSLEDHSGYGAAKRGANRRPSLFASPTLSEPPAPPLVRQEVRPLSPAPAPAAKQPPALAPQRSAIVWAALILVLIAAMFFWLQRWSREAFGPAAPRSVLAQPRHAAPVDAAENAPAVIENVRATPAQTAAVNEAPGAAVSTPSVGSSSDAGVVAVKEEDGEVHRPVAPALAPVDAGSEQRPASTGTARTGAEAAKQAPAARRITPPDPGRDVVVRTPEASTEELLARCRSLGVLEGELCRFRICSGRWGADAACPVTDQPASH